MEFIVEVVHRIEHYRVLAVPRVFSENMQCLVA